MMSMAMSETYSVVIPAYNAEMSIETCLASVIAQTLPPLEVLIIDDHSTDSTEAAIHRCEAAISMAGINFIYIRLENNSGPSVARNKGISLARGNFIAFLDADDVWHKDKLTVVDRFAINSNVGLLYHSFSQDLEFDSRISNSDYIAQSITVYDMLLRNPAATPCTIVRKRDVLAFNESMRYCEDYDLWMRIAEHAPILRLVGPPLTRLGRPPLTAGGLSGDTARMRVGEVRVYYNFCRRSWLTRAWILPGLLIFSFLKYVYSRIRIWTR